MGIYKRKQESIKTRKQELDQEKKKILSFFSWSLSWSSSCFLTFLFSFMNSHLWPTSLSCVPNFFCKEGRRAFSKKVASCWRRRRQINIAYILFTSRPAATTTTRSIARFLSFCVLGPPVVLLMGKLGHRQQRKCMYVQYTYVCMGREKWWESQNGYGEKRGLGNYIIFLLSLGYSCLNLAQFGPFVISSHLSTYLVKFMKHCESNRSVQVRLS